MVEFKINLLIFALLSITLASYLTAEEEPKEDCNYYEFSPYHSGCKERNPKCDIIDNSFTAMEKELIVEKHNYYRNQVAAGKVHEAGGLPKAANMMEMEWDTELAKIAQKWAEQCKVEHDCDPCRRVARYKRVGQLVYKNGPSNFTKTSQAKEDLLKKAIKGFYEKVEDFREEWVKEYQAGENHANFTQIVWAETRKIGCGKVFWKEEEGETFMLVCNYGPTGNEVGKPVYIEGDPGSKCPDNTCFGKRDCEIHGVEHNYKYLCKEYDPKNRTRQGKKIGLHPKDKTDDYPSHDYGYDDDYLPHDYAYGDDYVPHGYGYGKENPPHDYGYGKENPPHDYGYDDYFPHDYGYSDDFPFTTTYSIRILPEYPVDDYLPHDYGSRDDYHYGYNY